MHAQGKAGYRVYIGFRAGSQVLGLEDVWNASGSRAVSGHLSV